MSITQEREKYIQKLDLQIGGMNQLLSDKYMEVITPAKHDEISRLRRKAEVIRRKLASNEFEIAIIGLEKAGKSTFANALMGIDILPSMDARCTYTSTSIRYGDSDEAEVVFYTREEFARNFTDSLKTMGIEHAENLDFTTLSLSKYQELYNSLPVNNYTSNLSADIENIIMHRDTLLRYIGMPKKVFKGAGELESQELKNFIQNPAYAIAVKEITIRSSMLRDMQNAVIYDVPGFDSPTQMHKEQTIHMMKTCDVIVMIASAEAPSIRGPQVQIFESEVDEDGIPFNEKIFIFGNKADRANDSLEKNLGDMRADLSRFNIVRREFMDSRIILGSARAKLEAEGKLPDSGAAAKLAEKGITNGISEMRSKLEEYNDTERFETLKKRINRIYAELEETLSDELASIGEQGDVSASLTRIAEISTELLTNSENTIRTKLEELKTSIPVQFRDKPLSEEFGSRMERVSSDNYSVTEEEYTIAKNAASTTGGNIAVDKFEIELRKLKYAQLRDYFISTVMDVASDTHKKYDQKIHDIFMDALGVTASHLYKEELDQKITDYTVNISAGNRDDYYRSLVERFATDLFETIIRPNFGGRDRWTAYADRELNLHSLGIFYQNRDNNLPNNRQPILYTILFHDNAENIINGSSFSTDAQISELNDIIASNVPNATEERIEALKPLLRELYIDKGSASGSYVEKICKKNPDIDDVEQFLETEFDPSAESDFRYAAKKTEAITADYYNDRCSSEKLSSSDLDTVVKHLNTDLNILGYMLVNAAIPAIQIDNAFIYFQIHSIEKLLRSIDPTDPDYSFRSFISSNIARIACGQLADIEAEEKQRRLRQEICDEIRTVLGSIKNYSE